MYGGCVGISQGLSLGDRGDDGARWRGGVGDAGLRAGDVRGSIARVSGSGFRVSGVGCWGLDASPGVGVRGLGFRVHGLSLRSMVEGLEFGVRV